MHGSGAEDIDGDAYLPRYETRTSTLNPEYNAAGYYDYAVEIPANATGGEVWIYDPVFCATASSGRYGTGDRYFSGSAATSAFYELYDTRGTPYDLGDDVLVATSGNLFRGIAASDQSLNGPSGMTSCAQGATNNKADGRFWHNRWWPVVGHADAPCRSDLPSCSRAGVTGGSLTTTYRLRTRSTDASNNNSDSHNSFAIWARANGGTGSVKVHGIGAMEAFTPLDPAQDPVAEFYLAQIDAIHAGKTVAIRLWDPGDTNSLVADLQILVPRDPDGAGPAAAIYEAATFRWRSVWGTTNGNRAGCNNSSGSGVTSVRTNNGGSVGVFNGCWVTIEIPIPVSYDAPQPPGEPEPGWWKIRYSMSGTNPNAFDLTTWEVQIRGNPVHLVIP
jgi:hypothetical protein